jgi:hypothetical protein
LEEPTNGDTQHSEPPHEGQSLPPRRWSPGPLAQGRRPHGAPGGRLGGARIGSGTWSVITLTGKAKKGLAVTEVHELLASAGYAREPER